MGGKRHPNGTFVPLKIVVHLDGSGLYYDPHEPLHFDGVLAAMVSRFHVSGEPPTRDEKPHEIPLSLQKWRTAETWGFHASAFFPDGPTAEGLTKWRKRFRENRAEMIESASPNLTNATYRAWDMPLPLLMCRTMIAYAVGNRRRVKEAMRDLAYLGKKRAHGHGLVDDVDVIQIDTDLSMVSEDGRAQRFLPHANAPRLVRPRPPYWSRWDRVHCCDVGDPSPLG